jgi:formylglycine-generating enzyme required for sulfatase activity
LFNPRLEIVDPILYELRDVARFDEHRRGTAHDGRSTVTSEFGTHNVLGGGNFPSARQTLRSACHSVLMRDRADVYTGLRTWAAGA